MWCTGGRLLNALVATEKEIICFLLKNSPIYHPHTGVLFTLALVALITGAWKRIYTSSVIVSPKSSSFSVGLAGVAQLGGQTGQKAPAGSRAGAAESAFAF